MSSNRLALEQSPYLLQHAKNPVDWYAWGDEAFAKARAEQRPIFLSVGYSTCHWCHVMEHESFENADVARVLNDHFVAIKVDREERPDVDRVYMTFVQATTGSGGWPMSVWLTPDLQPFYGGTYFPPTTRWGRPGFVDILMELARLWRDERPRVLDSAASLTAKLRDAVGRGEAEASDSGSDSDADPDSSEARSGAGAAAGAGTTPIAGPAALDDALDSFRHAFDARNGGFGGEPKFPRPSELLFLLREFARTGEPDAKMMAERTLYAMALGGMRDHIGGGFHRYSVDGAWRVPHFEKMLYDQAQLVLAYLEGAQATGEAVYGAVAEDTLAYVRRDMTHAEGGFFSAEDADSVPPELASAEGGRAHASEGAFYIWSAQELDERLGGDADAEIVKLRFGVQPGGNAPHDPQGEFVGKNIFYTAMPMADIAERTGRDVDDVARAIGRARALLFAVRERRPRPHLDDKILTAWNGLMIAAFARAARTLDGQPHAPAAAFRQSAERAAGFIKRALWDESSGRLLRRWREGHAAIDAYSEDYASLIWGLLELFQATGEASWLDWAITLQRRLDALFWDEADGGWFNTTGDDASVLLRLKEEYDGAEPSASSVSVQNLMTLAHLTGDADAARKVERTLARFGARIGAAARAIPGMMGNLSAWHAGQSQIVIVGPRDREDTAALRRVVASLFLPFAVVVPIEPVKPGEPGEPQARLAALLPWTQPMAMIDGRATAYVCRNFACERPVTGAEDLQALLRPVRPA
jgi:uncharacterized protein YyaL (SSP411 family)